MRHFRDSQSSEPTEAKMLRAVLAAARLRYPKQRGVRRLRFVLLLSLVAAAVLYGAGAAYSSQFDWITSVTLQGSTSVGTNGFGPRNLIEDWRPNGSFCTQLYYEHTDGSTHYQPSLDCTTNPDNWVVPDGYARSWCINATSEEVHPYTCQTTN
jgi:hypothetical protein